MTIAILYRWRADPAKARAFEEAWAEGTRLIHEKCGSFGARLHRGEDGLYWSYALWPDEETRQKCFRNKDVGKHDSFSRMQEAIVEHFEEIKLELVIDLLDRAPGSRDE